MMRGSFLIGQNWAGTRFTRSQSPPLLEGLRGGGAQARVHARRRARTGGGTGAKAGTKVGTT